MTGLPDREEEANREIAATRMGGPVAAFLVVAFLLAGLAGAALEWRRLSGRDESLSALGAVAREKGSAAAHSFRAGDPREANERLTEALRDVEEWSGRDSALSVTLRPPAQSAMIESLRYGNAQVLIGRDGWLFFVDDLEHLAGPGFLDPVELSRRRSGPSTRPARHPDPLPVLLDLHADLAARGIGLVLLPVPTKFGLAAEHFLGAPAARGRALRNRSMQQLVERLERSGVDVFDPAPTLQAMEREGESSFLRLDSHWSPAAVDRVAAALAEHLRQRFGIRREIEFARHPRPLDRPGDLVALLGLGEVRDSLPPERLEVASVSFPSGRAYKQGVKSGPVALLGDSFSRIYVSHHRGQGDANLAAELAFHLGAPVTVRALNDAGAELERRIEWLRAPGFLDGRKAVVLEVAERAFSFADWPPLRLGPPV